MVDYRIGKLLDSSALLIRAMINNQRQQGLIFYELELSVDEANRPAVIRKLGEMYGEKLWSTQRSIGGVLFANLFGFSLGEPEESAMSSLGLEGVKSCSIFILKE